MSNQNNSSSGIGLAGLTFIVFLVLKLCGVINWSWWWVTAPLWGGVAIALFFLGLFAIYVSWKK
jgi:pilus assembly protein TadC